MSEFASFWPGVYGSCLQGDGGLHLGSRAPALSHPSDQIPNSPVFTLAKPKRIKRLKCCRGNLGVQRLLWQMVSGLGEGERLTEDKMEKGQEEGIQKETAQYADRRNGLRRD